MNLDMVDRNSAPEEFAYIWQSKRVGIITKETEKYEFPFPCDVFVVVSRRGIFKNSLIFTQDVTDVSVNTCCKLKLVFLEKRAGICFGKAGRQYFEISWGFYIKLKVSWLRAFLWCMSQTSRDRNNSRRVQTQEKDSGETVRRFGTIIQSIFVPNQEPASAWFFGNSSVRVGTQGLFRPYLKTFVGPFLPTRLTAPGSPRMPWSER